MYKRGIDEGITISCYTLNHFFRLLFDGRLYTLPYCGVLVTAAVCLPPGALNLQSAPAFANFWTNTNSKRIKTMHNGKWKAPPKESSSLRFPDEHGGSGSPGEKG